MKLLFLAAFLLQDATLEQLLQRLGADEFDDRNRASHELRKRGLAAVEPLRRAAESKDEEVVSRAREVLGLILDDIGRSTLKSFEEALDKAPSIRIDSATVALKDPVISFSAQGTLLRQQGGKIRVTGEGRVSEEAWKGFLVSDGERMMLESSRRGVGNRDWGYDGKDYWPAVRAAVTRVGAVTATHIWAYVRLQEAEVADLFELGGWNVYDAGSLRVLEYTIRWTGKDTLTVPVPVKTKVWYDSKTSRPVRRESAFSSSKDGPTVVEAFTYDLEIPAERFMVPEGKSK